MEQSPEKLTVTHLVKKFLAFCGNLFKISQEDGF